MAEQDRRQQAGKSKPPITSHPLFPAIVALWFGALFGLGSLAIRPGLLESMVLATHIDTLVPAAAPPLGLTSRILLALVMSGIGGLIGATIAHRIAAPRPERRERRRGAGVVAGSAHGVGEGRRRPLTGDLDYAPRDFNEHAPLPGGSPQILHVSDFDFADPAPVAQADADRHVEHRAEPLPPRDPAPERVEVRLVGGRSADEGAVPAPLELDTLAEAALVPAQVPEAHVSLSRQPAPAMPQPRRFDAPPAEGSFGIFEREAEAGISERFDAIAKAAPPLFGARAVASSDAGDTAPAAPAPAAGPAVAFAVPQPAPTPFAPPAATVTLDMAAAPPSAGQAEPEPIRAAAAEAPVVAPAATLPAAPVPAATGFAPPAGHAAERIAHADLAELSPVELIERLALSLQARRERVAVQPAETPEPVVAPVAAQPFAPPAAVASAPVAAAFARPAPVAIALEGTGIVPPAVSIPAALRPIGMDLDDDDGDNLPSYLPPRHIVFAEPAGAAFAEPAGSAGAPEPAAPAPFAAPVAAQQVPAMEEPAMDAFALEDAGAAPEPVADHSFTAPEAPTFARLPRGDEPDEDTLDLAASFGEDDSQALEEGYSSLLDLTRRAQSRQPFVRIEEPEPENAGSEPVVVFPGQAASSAPRPFDAPVATPAAAASRIAAAPVQSPEETERALRSALASLQRMSGAA